MGKDLKGKELGVGICQTKDKKYVARITTKNGKRIKRVFDKLVDCRKWIADARFVEEHCTINALGNMLLSDVKPFHCQDILNRMTKDYRNSTIRQIFIAMHCMFESAVDNELITRNPVTKAVRCSGGKESKPKKVLTVEEQKLFLKTVKNSSNYNQDAFLLQTGLRIGEMIGLKWSDIDFKRKVLHVRRTMEYRHSVGEWRVGEPKSQSGYRDVPLTKEAIRILKDQKEKIR